MLGNSRRVVDDLIDEHVAPARIGLIYNGVSLDAYNALRTESVPPSLGFSEKRFGHDHGGELSPRKAHTDAIEALALAAEPNANGRGLCCVPDATTDARNDLEAQIRQKGLQNHIRFLGERADVPDLLRASDMGILASHEEGFSNAILESMAAGLPMVVTNVGGNTEAIVDGRSGFVVPPACPATLADAIVRLANELRSGREIGSRRAPARARAFLQPGLRRPLRGLYNGLLAGRVRQ